MSLEGIRRLLMLTALLMCGAATTQASEREFDIRVNLTEPTLWTIDTVHLGNHQLSLSPDSTAAVLAVRPLWSAPPKIRSQEQKE